MTSNEYLPLIRLDADQFSKGCDGSEGCFFPYARINFHIVGNAPDSEYTLPRENRGTATMTPPPGIFARSRAVVTPQYAVMPPEGILASALPGFERTTVRIQTAPQMGARFAQMVLEMEPGGGTIVARDDGLEHVFYLLSGSVTLTIDGQAHELGPDGYAYVPT